jgi:periplasmic divalent cation tolerance protein
MATETIVVLITTPSPEVASAIAEALVRDRLAACVNMVPGITSIFWWENKVQTESEVLMIVKTLRHRYEALADRVRSLHPYTVPEIIALPLAAGNRPYLDWVRESVQAAR